jgi:hypothetical protein
MMIMGTATEVQRNSGHPPVKSSTGIYAHFADRPIGFEQFAAHLWQMADRHVGTYEVTRATADGVRDAIGAYLIALRCRVRAPA